MSGDGGLDVWPQEDGVTVWCGVNGDVEVVVDLAVCPFCHVVDVGWCVFEG